MAKVKKYTFEQKVSAVDEAEASGLAAVLPKFKITYATFLEWKTEVGDAELSTASSSNSTYFKKASSILTPGTGFMNEYDYTLNPYSGCLFGCIYCYAAFFSRTKSRQETWGHWLDVKENALELLKKFRKKPLDGKTIYMSSVTDPYQPIEKDLHLTRDLIQELGEFHQARLVVQTRSPFVARDADIYARMRHVQVNMTVTTDSETVRKVFEPLCPSNALRLKAVKELNATGVATCITITPLLPIENPRRFADMLLETGTRKFIIQPFHSDRGKFVASTGAKAMELIKKMNWNIHKYNEVVEVLSKFIPDMGKGKDGFKPI